MSNFSWLCLFKIWNHRARPGELHNFSLPFQNIYWFRLWIPWGERFRERAGRNQLQIGKITRHVYSGPELGICDHCRDNGTIYEGQTIAACALSLYWYPGLNFSVFACHTEALTREGAVVVAKLRNCRRPSSALDLNLYLMWVLISGKICTPLEEACKISRPMLW